MREQTFRKKVYIFSTILSILVIWVHSVNIKLFFPLEHPHWIDALQHHTIALGQIAVPGFFMLSAYLLFRNLNSYNLHQKLQRRFTSLVLPYFVWNTIYYAAYFFASKIPYLRHIIGKDIIAFGWSDMLEAIFLYKYNFVFWFVFQLILLICLTPVFYEFFQRQSYGFVFLLLCLLYLYFDVRIFFLNADALFYFALGAFLSGFHQNIVESDFTLRRFCIGISLAALSFILHTLYLKYGSPILAVITRSLGVTALWLCVWVPSKELSLVYRISFFVYAIHFLIVRWINKFFAYYFPNHALLSIGLFLFLPFLILLLSDCIVHILKKIAPWLYRILSGNR